MVRSLFALPLLLPMALPAIARELHVAQKPLADVAADEQFRSLGQAVGQLEPGDVLLVHGGVYREEVAVDKNGTAERPITIRAADGEQVVITGADRITDWTPVPGEEGVYSTSWPHKFIYRDGYPTHPGNEFHRLIGRCEQVFVNGYALHQVLDREALGLGTFYVDTDAERLYIRPFNGEEVTAENASVEASTRQRLLEIRGDHVHVKGIRFRYAANWAQWGAVDASGNDLVIEDCVFEYTNASGATFRGKDMLIRNCLFQSNGQLGFGVNRAQNLRMIGCTVRNNNTKGFDRDWEAGGDKIVLTRGAIFDHCTFVDNRGHGIWYDIGNEDCEVRNCLIANNENAGIFYEISYGLHAHDNVIVGNGLAFSPHAWGASAGISLSSSPDCIVERNLILGNKEGFNFREQSRTTRRLGRRGRGSEEAVWNHDQIVRNNVLAYNRDAQVWGWFDVSDERHWPKSMQATDAEQSPSVDRPRRPSALPADTSLEKLQFDFQDNLYCLGPGQSLFHWGVPWRKHKSYDGLAEIQQELSLAQGSALEELQLSDYAAYDLRVPANSPALEKACYPRGSVPGVLLGIVGTTPDE